MADEAPAATAPTATAERYRLVDRPDARVSVLNNGLTVLLVAPRAGPLYLLEHDVRPRQAWYYPAILGLLLALAVTNYLLRRRARRRAAAVPEGEPE